MTSVSSCGSRVPRRRRRACVRVRVRQPIKHRRRGVSRPPDIDNNIILFTTTILLLYGDRAFPRPSVRSSRAVNDSDFIISRRLPFCRRDSSPPARVSGL